MTTLAELTSGTHPAKPKIDEIMAEEFTLASKSYPHAHLRAEHLGPMQNVDHYRVHIFIYDTAQVKANEAALPQTFAELVYGFSTMNLDIGDVGAERYRFHEALFGLLDTHRSQ
jgi:hypothetical protein